jgi:hypothetical protein
MLQKDVQGASSPVSFWCDPFSDFGRLASEPLKSESLPNAAEDLHDTVGQKDDLKSATGDKFCGAINLRTWMKCYANKMLRMCDGGKITVSVVARACSALIHSRRLLL